MSQTRDHSLAGDVRQILGICFAAVLILSCGGLPAVLGSGEGGAVAGPRAVAKSEPRIIKYFSQKTPAFGARAFSYPRGGLAVPLPLRLIRGVHPLVRVTINDGRKLDLLVDTGANRTVLPPRVFGETYGQKIIHIEKLCFENGACFEDAAVSVVPTNYSQSRRGYYNGLLGVDLLQYTRLTIDYKNRRMFLAAGDGGTSGGAVIHSPFVRDQKTWRPHGTMSVRGAGFANILLDTGASMTRLTPSMLRRLETMPATAYLEMAFSATGVQGTEILSLRDVCINRQACVSEMLGQKASWAAVGCSFSGISRQPSISGKDGSH